VLRAGQSITGGGSDNTLELVGAGTFNLAGPTTLANIQVVDATEGPAGAEPFIYLRNGTTLTVNLAAAATSPSAAEAVVIGAANSDTINLGAGYDIVYLGGDGETVHGGSGTDIYVETAATIGATLVGGSGTNTLEVTGGGTAVMGANITGMNAVFLEDAGSAYAFTANATQGLVIHASEDTADTITLGSASQTVLGWNSNIVVLATAANAAAAVRGGSGTNTLDITTGGTVTLNALDSGLTVNLDAATTLTMNKMAFIHAVGGGGDDTIIAGGAEQVLSGGGGSGDTLEDAGHYGVTFQDTIAAFGGDTLADFSKADRIDITNLGIGSVSGTPEYTGGYGVSSTGTLAVVTTGSGTIDIKMAGLAAGGVFSAVSDGHGGTLISYS
jgi:Ca2+-binding RTX toxin-like protein